MPLVEEPEEIRLDQVCVGQYVEICFRMLQSVQKVIEERDSLRAEAQKLQQDLTRAKADLDYVMAECEALIKAWRDNWSGSEFDGRDTQRLFDRLRLWLEGGRISEPTECRDWYDRL